MDYSTINLINFLIGTTAGFAGKLNRGDCEKNDEGISISKENGLSAKIIKYFPKYRFISAAIDHIGYNVGVILVGGSFLDTLIQSCTTPMIPQTPILFSYALVATAVASLNCLDYFIFAKNRNNDISDHLQQAVDITFPLLTLSYVAIMRYIF